MTCGQETGGLQTEKNLQAKLQCAQREEVAADERGSGVKTVCGGGDQVMVSSWGLTAEQVWVVERWFYTPPPPYKHVNKTLRF